MNGVRVICGDGSLDLDSSIKTFEGPSEYNLIRHLLGIVETGKEVGNQFPLNLNLQHLNGVNFNKGCYIG